MSKQFFSIKNISLSIFLACMSFSCSVQNLNVNQEEFTNTENITEKSKISFSTHTISYSTPFGTAIRSF
ncbi:MAG: hypothetical protein AABZ74_03130 [Cyanobacteriota bacterium]